jgi:hypothetical protein
MRKWQTEEQMNAELRRIASEMRQLREELRDYMPSERINYRKSPILPTEDERKLRSMDQE